MIAQAGKQVLLIDADLRKGQVHHVLGCPETNGLSDALIGTKGFADIMKQTEIENLAFISRGQIPPNPSELLMNENFKKLMEWASSRYDLVIVDTPPVLAVSDACIAAQYTGTTMLVANIQINTLREMIIVIKHFKRHKLNLRGVILNNVNVSTSYY